MAKYSQKDLEGLDKPGRYGVGGGLYLVVTPTGTRNWIQRITINGKRTDKGLGAFPLVGLSEARKVAKANKAAVKVGINPWAKETPAPAPAPLPEIEINPGPTFAEAARRTFEAKIDAGELNSEHAPNWFRRIEKHAFPVFGNHPVSAIRRRAVVELLEAVGARTPYTAGRLRQSIREILNDCIERDEIEHNVAGEGVTNTVRRLSKKHKRKNYRALPYAEVPAALETIRTVQKDGDMKMVTLALQMTIFTGARGGEVRSMRWEHVDLETATWVIPAEMMKARREHRQPLSPQAVQILHEVDALRRDEMEWWELPKGLVFRGKRGRKLCNMAFIQRLGRIGLATTAHGFRSSLQSWSSENGYRWEVIETQLSHHLGDATVMAYARADYLDERRDMMQAWADFIDPPNPPF